MFIVAYLVLFLIAFVEDFLTKNVNLYTQFAMLGVTLAYGVARVFVFKDVSVLVAFSFVILFIYGLILLEKYGRTNIEDYIGAADAKILLFTIPVFAIYELNTFMVYAANALILALIVSGAQQIWCWIKKDSKLTTPAVFAVGLAFLYTVTYHKLIIGG